MIYKLIDVQTDRHFSVFLGVLVFYDDDLDTRVLDFVGELPEHVRTRLVSCSEHEGTISLYWRGPIPYGYESGGSIIAVDGDSWSIDDSVILCTQ